MKRLISIFLVLIYPFWLAAVHIDMDHILKMGREAKSAGEFEKALHIWESARDSSADDQADPRIGFEYIELAAEQNMTDYYRKASAMYIWGLSGCSSNYAEALSKEIERIRPIAGKDEYKRWKKMLKDNPPKACKALINFWKSKDPTISTAYNERLIEHWQRIAYAKEHFNRSRVTVYEADDRAPIYIRQGLPDRISKGIIHFSSGQVRGWVRDVIDLQLGGSSRSSFQSASGGGDSSSAAYAQMLNFMREIAEVENYVREARLLHNYPRYEIWVYKDAIEERYGNLLYIFGDDGNTGEFGLRRSMEDLLPNSAFRQQQGRILTPGLLLQLMSYEQVITADQYFANAFNDLESNIYTINGLHRSTSFAIKSKYASALSFNQFRAPQEKSTLITEMPNIPLNTFQYRFLDDNNDPYLATYVKGRPQKAFFFDQLKLNNFDPSNYRLYFHTMTTDTENEVIDVQYKTNPIYFQGEGNVEQMKPSHAYFEIPHQSEKMDQVFTVEMLNEAMESSRIREKAFSEKVRAIGKIDARQPKPLATDRDILEMSDLIVGMNMAPSDKNESGVTNFKVVHDNVIKKNTNLMVHFEVYHLSSKDSGPNTFKVEYQVTPKSRNIFKRLFGSGDKVGLTLNFETTKTFYKQDLEIDTSPFDTGRYKLRLIAIEPATNREVSREITFEIEEKEE